MAMVTITSNTTIAKYNKGQICIASVPVIKGQGKHEQDRALHCPNKISIATSHMPSSVIQDGAKVQEYQSVSTGNTSTGGTCTSVQFLVPVSVPEKCFQQKYCIVLYCTGKGKIPCTRRISDTKDIRYFLFLM